jgi:hypothetical protein
VFSPKAKYLIAGCDDGNIYILQSHNMKNGKETAFRHETFEIQSRIKHRETNGFRGYNLGDNLMMANIANMDRTNMKIDKLQTQIKMHEFNF